jgi:hypothetical protein
LENKKEIHPDHLDRWRKVLGKRGWSVSGEHGLIGLPWSLLLSCPPHSCCHGFIWVPGLLGCLTVAGEWTWPQEPASRAEAEQGLSSTPMSGFPASSRPTTLPVLPFPIK